MDNDDIVAATLAATRCAKLNLNTREDYLREWDEFRALLASRRQGEKGKEAEREAERRCRNFRAMT